MLFHLSSQTGRASLCILASATSMMQMGFAMTDPDPLYHPMRLTMFDPMQEPYNSDEHIVPKAAHFLGNLMRQAASVCTGICKVKPPWSLLIAAHAH